MKRTTTPWRNAISRAGALENIQDEPEASYSARKYNAQKKKEEEGEEEKGACVKRTQWPK